jgi:hypothetical protein
MPPLSYCEISGRLMAKRFQRLEITLPVSVEIETEASHGSFFADWASGLVDGFDSVRRRSQTRSSSAIKLSLVVPLEQRHALADMLRAAAAEIERE